MSDEQKVVRLNVNLAPDVAAHLIETAKALDVTVTEMVRRCISLDHMLRAQVTDGKRVWVIDPVTDERREVRIEAAQDTSHGAPFEIGRITVTRHIAPDGDDIHGVNATDGMSLVEALGMLRLAEDTLIQNPPADG